MYSRTHNLAVCLILITLFSVQAAAEPVGPKLTPRLKALIADEMGQISQATAALGVAIAAGHHGKVRTIGIAVRDSFILKASLTPQDKRDLMNAVPASFLALDQSFHELAGKLAHAGEVRDSELQSFYFSRMLDACVACHRDHAPDRFTGLVPKAHHDEQQHPAP